MESFLNKVKLRTKLKIKLKLLKKDSNTVFSCKNCKMFKSNYFEEHPWATASEACNFI